MSKNETITINYVLEKATTNTFRYMEVDASGKKLDVADGAKAPTYYVQKSALGENVPKRLTVTITAQ